MEAFAWILGGAALLDVRDPAEAAELSIPGGVRIGERELRARWGDLPRDLPLVIYCRRGNRSYDACGFLESKGFRRLANLEGGVLAWLDSGLPLDGLLAPCAPSDPEILEWIASARGAAAERPRI